MKREIKTENKIARDLVCRYYSCIISENVTDTNVANNIANFAKTANPANLQYLTGHPVEPFSRYLASLADPKKIKAALAAIAKKTSKYITVKNS